MRRNCAAIKEVKVVRRTVEQESVWTKEQYLDWLQRRGESGTWALADCSAADRHIKVETLKNFDEKLKAWSIPQSAKDWIKLSVDAHFGSVEVDDMLTQLNCYPTWMERPNG